MMAGGPPSSHHAQAGRLMRKPPSPGGKKRAHRKTDAHQNLRCAALRRRRRGKAASAHTCSLLANALRAPFAFRFDATHAHVVACSCHQSSHMHHLTFSKQGFSFRQ